MIAFIGYPELLYLINDEIQTTSYEVVTDSKDIGSIAARFKNATHYTHIIVDIDMFDQPQDELVNALYLLNSTNNTNLTVIARGYAVGDELLSELVAHGIYNLVTSYDRTSALKEMADCINGVELDTMRHYINPDTLKSGRTFFRFKKTSYPTITIGVCGIASRMGTTTQAIRLALAIPQISDRTVCYCEQSPSGHVEAMKNVYPDAKYRGGYIDYHNLHLYFKSKPSPTAYNYIIYDYGTDVKRLAECDLKLIICGSKAWELTELPRAFEQLGDTKGVEYIFSFASENEHADILDFMGERWTGTYFSGYAPDMFAVVADDEKSMYMKLLDMRPAAQLKSGAEEKKGGFLSKMMKKGKS